MNVLKYAFSPRKRLLPWYKSPVFLQLSLTFSSCLTFFVVFSVTTVNVWDLPLESHLKYNYFVFVSLEPFLYLFFLCWKQAKTKGLKILTDEICHSFCVLKQFITHKLLEDKNIRPGFQHSILIQLVHQCMPHWIKVWRVHLSQLQRFIKKEYLSVR